MFVLSKVKTSRVTGRSPVTPDLTELLLLVKMNEESEKILRMQRKRSQLIPYCTNDWTFPFFGFFVFKPFSPPFLSNYDGFQKQTNTSKQMMKRNPSFTKKMMEIHDDRLMV